MAQQPGTIDPAAFWGVFFATLRNVAAVIIAMGVLGTFGWRLASPSVDAFLQERLIEHAAALETASARRDADAAQLRSELARLIASVDGIAARLPPERPFIEFQSGGRLVAPDGAVFAPGDDVPFLYYLRRNRDCPSTVRIQFYDANINAITARYSYEIPAVQAAPSFGFQAMLIEVTLPDNIRPGLYSYAPRIIPDRLQCPGEADVTPAPSDFFEVVLPE